MCSFSIVDFRLPMLRYGEFLLNRQLAIGNALRCRKFFLEQLAFMKIGVLAIQLQQLFMRSPFDNPSFV
jgi:hypothetical protein